MQQSLLKMMGIDLGSKYIGIAVSDESGTVCTLKKPIIANGTDNDLRAIAHLAQQEGGVSTIVVGLPIKLNGKFGTMAKQYNKRIRILQSFTPIKVVSWDERLTTRQATQVLQTSKTAKKGNVNKVDSASAALILDSYITFVKSRGKI